MADNNIGNLISNYGDMSIEELGGSLLQRQSDRSEEHTSELQSRLHLVCRLLLEKKKKERDKKKNKKK